MNIEEIKQEIKYNCNVSDSQYWGNYSICGMLLSLRELYRHEHSLKLWDSIPLDEISPWIELREELWEKLENESLQDITIDGNRYNPFESEAINSVLEKHGLVYSGGYGVFHKPMFFLGKLHSKKTVNAQRIYYVEEELCHDLAISIAMVQGNGIYVRLEPLRDILWERVQGCKGGKSGDILQEAFRQYGITANDSSQVELYDKLKLVSYDVADVITAHELGEWRETQKNPEWLSILDNTTDRYTEFYLRGIKDLLADMSENGPFDLIVERKDSALLGIYLTLFDEVRKKLFPDIVEASNLFFEKKDWALIKEAQKKGYDEMAQFRQEVIKVWKKNNSVDEIGQFLKTRLES